MYFLANVVSSSIIISNGLKSIENVSAVAYAFTIVELIFVIINILAILNNFYVIFIFPFFVSLYNIVYSSLIIKAFNENTNVTYELYQMSVSIIILNIITFIYYVIVGNPVLFVIEGSFVKRDLKKVKDYINI